MSKAEQIIKLYNSKNWLSFNFILPNDTGYKTLKENRNDKGKVTKLVRQFSDGSMLQYTNINDIIKLKILN